MSAIPGFYTLYEVAEHLGVSHSQVSRYVASGKIEAVDLGNQKLIPKKALKSFQRPPRGNPDFLKRNDIEE